MPLVAPTVTGYSEFWGGSDVYAPLGVRSTAERRGFQIINRNRPLRAALDAYVNAATTPAISATYKRVEAVQDDGGSDLGGARPIETVTAVSDTGDATIAAALDKLLDEFNDDAIASYPADASGNGGGGKSGF